jgi:hypothetical protein
MRTNSNGAAILVTRYHAPSYPSVSLSFQTECNVGVGRTMIPKWR